MKNFNELVEDYTSGALDFQGLVNASTELSWSARVKDPEDGSVDWVGENSFADVYLAGADGRLTFDERQVILDAVTEKNK